MKFLKIPVEVVDVAAEEMVVEEIVEVEEETSKKEEIEEEVATEEEVTTEVEVKTEAEVVKNLDSKEEAEEKTIALAIIEVLEEDDKTYLKVRTTDGIEGYVLRQYISTNPPKTQRIEELEMLSSSQQKKIGTLEAAKSNLAMQIKTIIKAWTIRVARRRSIADSRVTTNHKPKKLNIGRIAARATRLVDSTISTA